MKSPWLMRSRHEIAFTNALPPATTMAGGCHASCTHGTRARPGMGFGMQMDAVHSNCTLIMHSPKQMKKYLTNGLARQAAQNRRSARRYVAAQALTASRWADDKAQ